jgi:hypothetical protein
MNPFKFIHWPAFLISLTLGIFAVYITDSPLRQIYIYPGPDTLSQVQYHDATGATFTYEQEETECPEDTNQIYRIPVQH